MCVCAGEWKLAELEVGGGLDGDEGLVMSVSIDCLSLSHCWPLVTLHPLSLPLLQEAAKHYAISTKLERPFVFAESEAFVVQYEVNFQEGLSCGGAYVKLLMHTDDLDLVRLHPPPFSVFLLFL